MWFRSKPKNRRLGREHVLDVKLRSSQVRSARARLLAMGLGSFFAVVLGAYLLWCAGEWALNEFVYQNRAFAIEQIDVETDGALSPDQLRRWIGVKPNDNLLALDLARVQRDLKLVPVIQSVAVERIPPRTLRIRVVEREPIAEVRVARPKAGGGIEMATYYLDEEGYVMLPLEPGQRAAAAAEPPELPILSGVNPNELQPGRRVGSVEVTSALRFLQAFERSPMVGLVDLKKVEISSSDVLVVTTGQGSALTFGFSDPERQLRRWREVYDNSLRMGKVIGTLDLAVTNNLPISWLEASVVPPVRVKSPKTLLNKKKHV